MLSMFLAFAKRRDDIILSKDGNRVRKNIDGYNLKFVDNSIVLMSGIVIVSYVLYVVSPEIQDKYNSNYAITVKKESSYFHFLLFSI